jgi:hypothetical protein
MRELYNLQCLFGAALTDRARDASALPLIAGSEIEARERLAIYRANVAANAARALAAIYPIVRQLVGAEFFNGLAHAYRTAHPSDSGDLNALGGKLADFLPAFEPAQLLPYLPDVARLEWLAHEAHFAADHAPLDVPAMARMAEHDLTRLSVKLHPAVAVLSSAYPLFQIWQVHQDDYSGDIAVDLESGGEHAVIHRPQFRVAVAKLTSGEAVFLNKALAGEALVGALEAALAGDPAFDLTASLRNWVMANIVVGLASADERAT